MPSVYKLKDPSKLFFTSDTHFNHRKIVEVANRPFEDVHDMNATIIRNWNRVVDLDSTIFILGDFTFDQDSYYKVSKQLNGRKIFVRGNHDHWMKKEGQYDDIAEIDVDGQFIVCCHYPMMTWNKAFHGSWHLFGHVHYSFDCNNKKMYNCCVDCNNYTPVSFNQLKEYFKDCEDNKL